MPQWLVIGISGVTCGGKTTLSHNLRDFFQSKKNAQLWQLPFTIGDVQLISQDDYFLPVDDLRHKWIDKLNAINFELLTSLDMKTMLSDITWTMKGRYLAGDPLENIEYMNEISMSSNFEHFNSATLMPPPQAPPPSVPHYHNKQQQQQQHHYHYHHHQQQRRGHQHHHGNHQHQVRQSHHQQPHMVRAVNPVNLTSQSVGLQQRDCKVNILIIEGFMIFNQPELLTLCNIKFHCHLPYEKCYERRRKRTYDPPDVTGYFEMCVWPHYEQNFAEFRDRKDITFLNGEISKEKICRFALQKIMKYVEERCDALMTITTTTATATTPTTSTYAAPPPHKLIGIHNGSNNTAKPCPMEQQ